MNESAPQGPGRAILRSLPSAGMVVGATVVLSLLGPALQVGLKLPPGQVSDLLVRLVVLLPIELLLIPRFLIQLDAEVWDSPENPRNAWPQTFEERWMRLVGAKLLLGFGLAAGLSLLVLPGMVVMILFGWLPMRVLLRGEPVGQAGLESARLMRQAWPRAIPAVAAVFGIYLLAMLGVAFVLHALSPQGTPWDRLVRPAFWLAYGISGVMEVALSTALWAIYRWLDPAALPK